MRVTVWDSRLKASAKPVAAPTALAATRSIRASDSDKGCPAIGTLARINVATPTSKNNFFFHWLYPSPI